MLNQSMLIYVTQSFFFYLIRMSTRFAIIISICIMINYYLYINACSLNRFEINQIKPDDALQTN